MGLRIGVMLATTAACCAAAVAPDCVAQVPHIVVNAQRSEQPIEDVPVSVSALDGEHLRAAAVRELADVVPLLPAVRAVSNDPGLPQVYIRGFGTNPFNPGFESSVGLVQDDIYLGRPGYFNEPLFDVARVEVLRGPQGTLFGKNTSAGLFGVQSRLPGARWSGDARLTLGEHAAQRLEGGAGGRFADWGAVRVAGLYREEDGELFNTLLARNEQALRQSAGRLNLLLSPAADLSTQVLAQTSDTRAAYWPFQLLGLDADTRTYLQAFDAQVEDDPRNQRTSMNTPGIIERGATTVGMRTHWRLDGSAGLDRLAPLLVLAHSDFDLDQFDDLDVSPADIAQLDSREDHRQRSVELRVQGARDDLGDRGQSLEFLVGLYAYDAQLGLLANARAGRDLPSFLLTPDFLQLASANHRFALPGGVGVPGLPVLGGLGELLIGDDRYRFDYRQDVASSALFGQLGWHPGERWAYTLGLRLNHERKRAIASGSAICPGRAAGLPRPCALQTLIGARDHQRGDLRRSVTEVSPRLVAQYRFEAGQLYLSHTRGFKSGGFNAISLTGEDLEFDDERARATELGGKLRTADGRLRLVVAVHRTRFDRLQVLAFNGVFFDVGNAASATSQGLEAEFEWATGWPGLNLAGSFGLLDARYDEYRDAPAPVAQGIGARQDLSGRRIAFAPRHTASLRPSWQGLLRAARVRVAVDLLHQGEQFTDADLDPATRSPAHTRIDARATVSTVDARWSLTLGGSNLGDRRVLNQVVDSAFFPGTHNAIQARGRQLFVTLGARF